MAENDANKVDGNEKSLEIDVRAFAEEARRRIQAKSAARQENLAASSNRPDEDDLCKLDSSLKRNNGFVKRLRTLTESQRATLLADFSALNLSKYVGEAAQAIVDAKLKMSDVQLAVDMCSQLHQRYGEFQVQLLDAFRKLLPRKKDDKVTNPSKLRVDLRLFAELIVIGVLNEKEALPMLGGALSFLVNTDKTEHQYLPIISAFSKFCGEDYAGTVPKSIRLHADKLGLAIPTSCVFSAERRKNVHSLLLDYLESLNKKLIQCAADVKRMENRNRTLYQTKGEIPQDAVHRLTEGRASVDKLLSQVQSLAELLEGDVAQLQLSAVDDEGPVDMTTGMLIGAQLGGDWDERLEDTDGELWEDADTKHFYTSLPELRDMLPAILYRESEKAELEAMCERVEELSADATPAPNESAVEPTHSGDGQPPDMAELVDEKSAAVDETDPVDLKDSTADDTDQKSARPTMALLMDEFEVRLPTLINRKMIDDAAVDFVTNMNTKANRKRLLRAVYGVRATRPDLLPFYGRLVAVLLPVMPDLGTELVRSLLRELRGHIYHKNQLRLESKLRCCRFIGELTKFGVCPKSEALAALQRLLIDLRHHNIDMACALLETCGRYLYKSAASHMKTKLLLDQLVRKKQASLHLDGRYALMIDNACVVCKPAEGAQDGTMGVRRQDLLTPLQQYVEYLVCVHLNKNTVERCLKELRSVDWTDCATADFVIGVLSQPHRLKFSNVEWLACLVAGLMWYHEWVGVRVADTVLEHLRLGMELNNPQHNGRRLTDACLLAHLVALTAFYMVWDCPQPDVDTPMDSFTHVLRVRLCCELLRHCGEYFDRGMSAQRLNTFWAYLQRYYWRKRSAPIWDQDSFPFPVEIKNLIEETHEFLPLSTCKLFKSAEEAETAVQQIEEKYRAKVAALLSPLPDGLSKNPSVAPGHKVDPKLLHAIAEDMEEGDELVEEQEDGDEQLEEGDVEGGLAPGERRAKDEGAAQRSEDERSESGSSSSSSGDSDEADDESDGEEAQHEQLSGDELEVTVLDEQLVDENAKMEEASALDQMIQQMVSESASQQPTTAAEAPATIQIPANVRVMIQRRARFADDEQQQELEHRRAGDAHSSSEGDTQPDTQPETQPDTQPDTQSEQISFKFDPASRSGGAEAATVPFALITRGKQSKPKLKTFKVEHGSSLVAELAERQRSEQAEKRKLKLLTLGHAGRQQQEELDELTSQVNRQFAPLPHGPVRGGGRQQPSKFVHQKGAPGASHIFDANWDS